MAHSRLQCRTADCNLASFSYACNLSVATYSYMVSEHVQERFKHGEGAPRELAIIVGRGQHPQQGGPKLKDTVQQLLQQHLHMDLTQVRDCPVECVMPLTYSLMLLVHIF